jgi:ribosomal protein S18 acetylase RimI-like enzyme
MNTCLRYQKEHEPELLALLEKEPDWISFLSDEVFDTFKNALLESETFICKSQGTICGYIRALIDGFGIYISELYVAPDYRGNGYGSKLLTKVKHAHPNQHVYVFSDEDIYYEKLGYKRVGSVFQL